MPDRAISVRLDDEAVRALRYLTRDGVSQSEAIRTALIATSLDAWRKHAREDAQRLGDDPADRALIAEIRAFMDEPDSSW